jgi:hypothetical protein
MIKYDYILGYLYSTRKGISEKELYELIPNLTEHEWQKFESIFGFLLIHSS